MMGCTSEGQLDIVDIPTIPSSSSDSIAEQLVGIPRIEIVTEDSLPILSKVDKLKARLKLSDSLNTEFINTTCIIRGRGNYTWKWYPKKSYLIKFDSKQSPCGLPANKDWVLLAEANDRTLLRTAYMCEVSKAVGLPYTVDYKHVELFVNGEYLGMYVLTDKIEKGKSRIKIENDGFIFESDNYYSEEPLYITSDSLRFNYTFKYPKVDDGDMVVGDNNYLFIKTRINEMERSFLRLANDSKDDDYLRVIDVETFAKWFVASEIISTYDPNYFYVLPSKESKIEMYPMWDAEWSVGLWPGRSWGGIPSNFGEDVLVWENKGYFQYLLKSPAFLSAVEDVWNKSLNKLGGTFVVDSVENSIKYCQEKNFKKWPNPGHELNVRFNSWEEETDYARSFYLSRFKWFNKQVENRWK